MCPYPTTPDLGTVECFFSSYSGFWHNFLFLLFSNLSACTRRMRGVLIREGGRVGTKLLTQLSDSMFLWSEYLDQLSDSMFLWSEYLDQLFVVMLLVLWSECKDLLAVSRIKRFVMLDLFSSIEVLVFEKVNCKLLGKSLL